MELPDVNTTNPQVISTYNTWISSLVSTYGSKLSALPISLAFVVMAFMLLLISSLPDPQSLTPITLHSYSHAFYTDPYLVDGLRIDSVKCTQQAFFPGFNSAAGVYSLGEVAHGDPDYVCPYTNYLDGIINYPLYYPLVAAFSSTSGNMPRLKAMVEQLKSQCKDSTLMAPFLENHDQPRFPSMTSDQSLIRNAILTTLMSDGPPMIYQGQEWALASNNDPSNREAIWLQSGAYAGTGIFHGYISQINQIRNFLTGVSGGQWGIYANNVLFTDNNSMVLRKGFDGSQSVTLVTNQGGNGAKYTIGLGSDQTGWSQGDEVYELLGCGGVTIGNNGTFFVTVQGGVGQIWVEKSLAIGSGICGL